MSFEILTCPVWPVLHGPHSGTITAPATPALPLWTWAATAFPLRPVKVSFQLIVRVEPLSVTVAVNAPLAPAGAFGFGTSAPGAERGLVRVGRARRAGKGDPDASASATQRLRRE